MRSVIIVGLEKIIDFQDYLFVLTSESIAPSDQTCSPHEAALH